MIRLIVVSIIWAFSFSLIGNFIVGKMDTYLAIWIRFSIAFLVFLPFIKTRNLLTGNSLKVMGIGALQIGLMYIFYFNSFHFLSVVEVALFTVLTPLYISLIGSALERRLELSQLVSVFLVIIGALVIKWSSVSENFFFGFLMVQAANLSFGLGQVLYKRYINDHDQKETFSLFYIGALVPITILVAIYSDLSLIKISNVQWGILFWLGAIGSGLSYYLWNSGSKLVSYGELAVMNNVVIPLAIIVNLVFWKSEVSWPSFLIGSFILTAGVFLEKFSNHSKKIV
ncbi:EamA family transporter [Halobacteriovorax sp.]|uniref:EamA family transporter n=1 Tax=Halobacteriovorax sp. TaxID=2020862 RepID=UPI0035619920